MYSNFADRHQRATATPNRLPAVPARKILDLPPGAADRHMQHAQLQRRLLTYSFIHGVGHTYTYSSMSR